jgi:phosphate starvation-inducible protein PhoH
MAKPKKARSRKDEEIEFLTTALENNAIAGKIGKKKKTWSTHDLKNVKPLTYGQEQLFEAYFSGSNILANGSAGTGKSFSAIYLALCDILRPESKQDTIIIVRSAVQVKAIGFLPGALDEKLSPYEEPYRDIFSHLLQKKDAYDSMKETGQVKFMATSFIRGLTWENAIIIIDEMQSMTFHEICSVITRMGKNSKLIMCGDISQNDLVYNRNEVSGFLEIVKILEKMKSVEIVNFTEEDIVRSGFVKEFIIAKQSL